MDERWGLVWEKGVGGALVPSQGDAKKSSEGGGNRKAWKAFTAVVNTKGK